MSYYYSAGVDGKTKRLYRVSYWIKQTLSWIL